MRIKSFTRASLLMLAVACCLPSAAQTSRNAYVVGNDDDTFLALREAVRRDDAAAAAMLADRLPNYTIPSYVDYYRLKARLRDASAADVRAFLTRYEGSAIADRMRNDWLLELGKTRDWTTFDEQYPLFVLNDDTQVKCYALLSKAIKGQPTAEEARGLLTAAQNYGEACPALIVTLLQNGQFTVGDVWAQMRLAAEAGNTGVARRIVLLAEVPEALVMQAIEKPDLLLNRGAGAGRGAHEAFIIALGRSARNDPQAAANALQRNAAVLSASERALGWAQIALQAALKLSPDAMQYWRLAQGAPLSYEGCQWQVRSGLRAGDWQFVHAAVDAMPQPLRTENTWIYWYGRALQAEGRSRDAQLYFQSIAATPGFYGQLAIEELGEKITLPPRAAPVSPDEIKPMQQNAGFRRAMKFFDLDLRFEGYREWNWELRRMNERQHLAAAEFARQNNLLDRMVNTSDRTQIAVDFTQRFPSPYADIMRANALPLGLDVAWVYGLIRQESRFIMNARSHVGASGLMQIMPATARWVARKIGMDGFTANQVNDIPVNIRLGANYLKMVLGDLDGSQALATAAYNAGPGRPRAWRATLQRPVEGAIFAESIPFAETRGYVKNVLSNATYYAAMFDSQPQSLKARLGSVAPKGFVASELP
ncbi:MAG: lytic transglycosylase domain-containing protein [Herminiimonas sp.]|nr:lytic transglycosylase domain-containing protein [Herminiimonas sp.]